MYERKNGDDLLSEDTRLQYKWEWSRSASRYNSKQLEKWTHFQCSESKSVSKWRLGAIQWGNSDNVRYEARIEYIGDHIASSRGNDFKTRIEAQIGAEKMLRDWITTEYKKIINKESCKTNIVT